MISPHKGLLLLPILTLYFTSCERSDDAVMHMPSETSSGKTAADYQEELTPVQALLARARGNVNAAVLKQWALALRMHAESEEGRYAESLKTLINTDFLPKPEGPSDAERAIAAAKGEDRKPHSPESMPRSVNEMGTFLEKRETPYPPQWTNLATGEMTLPLYNKGLSSDSPEKTILLAGSLKNPDGTRDVAYIDCSTARIPEEEFQLIANKFASSEPAP